MVIDLTDGDRTKAATRISYRAGVRCHRCLWRGYRAVRVLISENLSGRPERIDWNKANERIRGKSSHPCPICHGSVYYTHFTRFPT